MNILLICEARLPVFAYGGTERVVWDLAQALAARGHRVRLLAGKGSQCPFADVLIRDPRRSLREQVPDDTDVVHFHARTGFDPDRDFLPYLYTQHGNETSTTAMPLNAVFVSANHARRFGSDQFVHNGLDWAAYGDVDFRRPRQWLHFLGNAAWRVKNLKGAIRVAREAGEILAVLGGHRLNIKRGFRLTLSPRVRFFGMVGGEQKLHFRQLKGVLKRMGLEWESRVEHIDFGLLLGPGRTKLASRKGAVLVLDELLDEVAEEAFKVVSEKNPSLDEAARRQVSEQVGIGAVVFNDLKRERVKDVEFDKAQILSFEGDTGPYVQYAHARLASILRKAEESGEGGAAPDMGALADAAGVVLALARHGVVLRTAAERCEPSLVAQHLLALCREVSSWYAHSRVLGQEPGVTAARLRLVRAAKVVIGSGLAQLGVAAPESM